MTCDVLSQVPGKATGAYTGALTELVSVYPTLAALTSTPLFDKLDGASFADVFDTPSQPGPLQYTFSQYDHCHNAAMPPYDNTNCTKGDVHYMGFSIRSVDWRYTAWYPFDVKANCADMSADPFALELYDHRDDDGTDFDAFGNNNVAGDSTYSSVLAEMHTVAQQQWAC